MALFTIANVLCRTFFDTSIAFAEEISKFLILFVTFIGSSYAVTEARHIRMSAIYDMQSDSVRKFLMCLITLGTSLLMAALTYWAIDYVQVIAKLNSRSASLNIPLYLVYLSFPIGLGLTSIKYFLAFLKNLTSKDIHLSVKEKEHRKAGAQT